jgi:hypothetical protein
MKQITGWIFTIVCFAIGLWPIGLAIAIFLIYRIVKDEKYKEKAKNAEVEIYKTAAELEHKINTEK